jgi:hypothetical protein
VIPKEYFDEWLEHPVTKCLMQRLEEEAEAHREVAFNGGITGDTFTKIGEDYVVRMNTAIVFETVVAKMAIYQEVIPDEEREPDDEEGNSRRPTSLN